MSILDANWMKKERSDKYLKEARSWSVEKGEPLSQRQLFNLIRLRAFSIRELNPKQLNKRPPYLNYSHWNAYCNLIGIKPWEADRIYIIRDEDGKDLCYFVLKLIDYELSYPWNPVVFNHSALRIYYMLRTYDKAGLKQFLSEIPKRYFNYLCGAVPDFECFN